MGFQNSFSLRNRPPSSLARGQDASAHAGRGGRSRPRAATPALRRPARSEQRESLCLASPWAGAPRLLHRRLGSSGPPDLRPPGPWPRPPHLQPEGGPVPLHQGNAEGLHEPTPSAPARPRSPLRLRARRPRARVRAAPRLRPDAQGRCGRRLGQLSGFACACAGGPGGRVTGGVEDMGRSPGGASSRENVPKPRPRLS